ncbi:omega-hydroxypalmitate O-feruloyl transferase-like [Triticum dicoccoides]|uniref:omega-hydroxypalmitate O-feruloyl transferase-like n=1 Tax=Triticum dicoccoides TaxID=85692 RepID=UPI00188DFAEA|nr:omega-hydroxypalmitate O-feruloyl transferase-like [Triticum dicoccoides]
MAKDSRVLVLSRSTVKASVTLAAAPRVVAVFNLDLLPQSIPNSLFCVYRRPNAGGGLRDVVAAFGASLPSLLDHLLPLTGRIVADPRSGRPELLHCDNQGAELVVGEVGVALASLNYGNLGASLAGIGVPVQYDAAVALSVQLVSFACGGFAVAWASNHMLLDGYSLCMLANAWSELARSGAVSAAPNQDRSVFRPRAPPSYSPSLGEAFTAMNKEHLVNALTTESSFVQRTYYVEARDLEKLRAQASRSRATRLEALSAYLWKALVAVVGSSDKRCRMGWWVDGRRRLTALCIWPPLPLLLLRWPPLHLHWPVRLNKKNSTTRLVSKYVTQLKQAAGGLRIADDVVTSRLALAHRVC